MPRRSTLPTMQRAPVTERNYILPGSEVEGRKSLGEIDQRDHGGQMVELAKKLRRRKPKGGRRSL
jgi:hypothetical protein